MVVLLVAISKKIKTQLKHLQKGSKTIDEYMRGIRSKADQLALLGKPLDHEDLLDYILDGLGDEYKSIADTQMVLRRL